MSASGVMSQQKNKLESKFHDMIGPVVEYVSFTFWKTLPNGTHITPDFKVPGQSKVIEVFGDYWHLGEDPKDRIELWESVGIECLVVWEHEIHESPELVKTKVHDFITSVLHERKASAS